MRRLLLPLCLCGVLAACAPGAAPQAEPFAEGPRGETVDIPAVTPGSGASGATLAAVPHRVLPGGLLEIGVAGAPHTLLLFVTPGSPYSARYVSFLLPRVVREFVASGTLSVHVAFVEFARYPGTPAALRHVLCAAEGGAGPEALSALVSDPGAYAAAAPAGLTRAALAACADTERIGALAARNAALAHSLGVTLVPTAFLDGQRQTGLPEEADLLAWIRSVTAPR